MGLALSGPTSANCWQIIRIPAEIIDLKPNERFPDKYRAGDVRDLDSLRSATQILSSIWRPSTEMMFPDKTEYVRTNVLGAENTARICTEKGIRKIVFTSTVAVYGFAEPGTGESGHIKPFNEYGRTKFVRGEATGLA